MNSFLKRAYIAFDILLPGTLAVFLIAKNGLAWVFAVILLECIQALTAKRFMENTGKNYDLSKAVLTSASIVAGAILFSVKGSPAALGAAAAILVVVIHFAVYLIMAGFIRR